MDNLTKTTVLYFNNSSLELVLVSFAQRKVQRHHFILMSLFGSLKLLLLTLLPIDGLNLLTFWTLFVFLLFLVLFL